jgi:hypothetical protein
LALVKFKASSHLEDKEMSRITSPIDAVVEFVTAPKDGTYGAYCGVKFKTIDGAEIWKNYGVDSEELGALTKGLQIQLVPVEKDGKTSHQIILPGSPSTASAPAAKPSTASPPAMDKRSMATTADELAKFYRYCLDLVLRETLGEFSPLEATPIALEIFRQALESK